MTSLGRPPRPDPSPAGQKQFESIVSDNSKLLELCTEFSAPVLESVLALMRDSSLLDNDLFVHNLKGLIVDHKLNRRGAEAVDQTGLLKQFKQIAALDPVLQHNAVLLLEDPTALDHSGWRSSVRLVHSLVHHANGSPAVPHPAPMAAGMQQPAANSGQQQQQQQPPPGWHVQAPPAAYPAHHPHQPPPPAALVPAFSSMMPPPPPPPPPMMMMPAPAPVPAAGPAAAFYAAPGPPPPAHTPSPSPSVSPSPPPPPFAAGAGAPSIGAVLQQQQPPVAPPPSVPTTRLEPRLDPRRRTAAESPGSVLEAQPQAQAAAVGAAAVAAASRDPRRRRQLDATAPAAAGGGGGGPAASTDAPATITSSSSRTGLAAAPAAAPVATEAAASGGSSTIDKQQQQHVAAAVADASSSVACLAAPEAAAPPVAEPADQVASPPAAPLADDVPAVVSPEMLITAVQKLSQAVMEVQAAQASGGSPLPPEAGPLVSQAVSVMGSLQSHSITKTNAGDIYRLLVQTTSAMRLMIASLLPDQPTAQPASQDHDDDDDDESAAGGDASAPETAAGLRQRTAHGSSSRHTHRHDDTPAAAAAVGSSSSSSSKRRRRSQQPLPLPAVELLPAPLKPLAGDDDFSDLPPLPSALHCWGLAVRDRLRTARDQGMPYPSELVIDNTPPARQLRKRPLSPHRPTHRHSSHPRRSARPTDGVGSRFDADDADAQDVSRGRWRRRVRGGDLADEAVDDGEHGEDDYGEHDEIDEADIDDDGYGGLADDDGDDDYAGYGDDDYEYRRMRRRTMSAGWHGSGWSEHDAGPWARYWAAALQHQRWQSYDDDDDADGGDEDDDENENEMVDDGDGDGADDDDDGHDAAAAAGRLDSRGAGTKRSAAAGGAGVSSSSSSLPSAASAVQHQQQHQQPQPPHALATAAAASRQQQQQAAIEDGELGEGEVAEPPHDTDAGQLPMPPPVAADHDDGGDAAAGVIVDAARLDGVSTPDGSVPVTVSCPLPLPPSCCRALVAVACSVGWPAGPHQLVSQQRWCGV
eukprot:TRINITY_DN4068_c0_g1_i1.p1 TRINITY_DN4068_c0_g1~~TRINITY_DN4068_c0_g1_i1.p1  ORF type:complete len:1034 (-),score=406.16 TRINITY_DN4068_c0_g1_i1:316-3417(-)